jgi:hypothetical protein
LLLLALGAGLATRELAGGERAMNARYLLLLADAEPDGSARRDLLRAALAANGRSTTARIRLGLELEQARETEAAEQSLLEAARLDHQMLPAWTLANFYFRHDDKKGFWKWGARAGALTYDDYRPLLLLADRLEADAEALLLRLDAGHGLTRAYLDFTIGHHRMDAAQKTGRALLRFHNPADRERILNLADRQSAAGRRRDAEELWNAVAEPPR